jgi:class 3 adenylate cyclase/tetratricopeptide (TPR) repeat protein
MREAQLTTTSGAAAFTPYLPRLVIEWANDHADKRFRELDGSLVSIDISGFTSLSERLAGKGRIGAEELILLLSGVFEGLIGVTHRYDGDVLKFRGDALLLFFSGEGHEERACGAASGMQWFIETAGSTMSSVGPVELRMSTGVYSGPCEFFLVDASHRELVVVGPAATRTFELEDASEAGEILVSERTAEALGPGLLDGERDGARLLVRREPEAVETHASNTVLLAEAETGLDQYIPVPLRAHLAVASGEAEHRQVTVAFLKFSDTDGILEREGSEALGAKLQALATVVGDTCSTYGVTWLESDIDRGAGKFYLTAGAPSSSGSDEEAMLRVLRAVIDAGEGPPLRAGVNRGHVFAGDIGATSRRTYAVMGDAVNLAARLCSRAEVGHILSTGDVLDRSGARFETERQPFLVKGKERPITAYRVGSITGTHEEEATRALPLVGRETEVAALREAINSARMMQSRVVELVGEPGIGKSRLVEEVKTLAVGFNQLVAGCERYSQSEPFFPWRNVLRRLAGITPEQSREEAGAQLQPWVGTVMPDLAPWLPLLAIPLDADVPSTPEVESIDEAFRFDRLQHAVEQFLQRVLMMPTLLVFEDVHWMDDASRFLISRLTRQATPRPWLVCLTTRPEGESMIVEGTPGTRLVLEPISAEDAATLALSAAEEEALSQEALSMLAERSGGNPLFVRELVAASKEGRSLEALPETVETLMTTRIDTLEPGDRMLLRYASVVGPRFDLTLLGEILSDELPDAGDLARWERLGEFVAWEGSETLAFRHDLVRATAYEGLSFRRRRAIHRRLGEVLERQAGDRVDEAAALLSLHFLEAQEYEKAWGYAVAAADQARAKFANVVAGELYDRALSAADHLELPATDVAPVWEALGDVAERFADFPTAAHAYERAAALVEEDRAAQARLTLKRGIVCERGGAYEDAIGWYEKGLEVVERLALADGSLSMRAQLEVAYAGIRHRQGQFAEAIEVARSAAVHAEEAGDRRELAHSYYLLDVAHTRLGRPDRSYRELALPIFEEIGDLIGQANVLNNLGVAAQLEGRWSDALDAYRSSEALRRQAGDVVGTATQKMNEAEILSLQGHLDDAEPVFQEALRIWRAARFPLGAALATSNLARIAAHRGSFEEAHELYGQALAGLEEIGSAGYAHETKAQTAECLVLEGRYKEAEELASDVLSAVTAAGDPGVLGAMLERLLGYALHQGREPERARPHFEASLRIARELPADYEAALTLKAMAETGYPAEADPEAEYRALFSRLGVVSVPSPPLP